MAAPLLQLGGVALTFGGTPLLDGVDLTVAAGDRVCLVRLSTGNCIKAVQSKGAHPIAHSLSTPHRSRSTEKVIYLVM